MNNYSLKWEIIIPYQKLCNNYSLTYLVLFLKKKKNS